MELEAVGAVSVRRLRLQVLGQVNDGDSPEGTLRRAPHGVTGARHQGRSVQETGMTEEGQARVIASFHLNARDTRRVRAMGDNSLGCGYRPDDPRLRDARNPRDRNATSAGNPNRLVGHSLKPSRSWAPRTGEALPIGRNEVQQRLEYRSSQGLQWLENETYLFPIIFAILLILRPLSRFNA